jgi:hypothetical protein
VRFNIFPISVLTQIVILGFLAVLILAGCGGAGGKSPVVPSSAEAQIVESAGNRLLWGIWDVYISADRRNAEVVPIRAADMHLNVVRFLEVTPCKTCLTIENLHVTGTNELEADVTLTHPFPGLLKYTGFDVRGIFISGADFTFPVSGRKIAWGDTVPRMLNPDGYTPLFNPTEYPPANPPALGYIPGKKATGGDLSATLNPFVAYRRDAPRRMFEAGGSETRTVTLYVPPGPIHFGYAIDACWQPVDQVIDPITDFPMSANCLEAYRMDVSIGAGLLSEAGSQVPIQVEIYDHQGQETISTVSIEAPDLFTGQLSLVFSGISPNEAFVFAGTLTNDLGAADGEYPLLVRATDWGSDPNLGNIAAWQVARTRVGEPKGWARTWGGETSDLVYSVAIDTSGNSFVTGLFAGTVDFDPGGGVDNHTSNGGSDAFLSKFAPSGEFLWARTWGGGGGSSVAIDALGNAYVVGAFYDVVDFDPGSGVDSHTPNGNVNAYLSKFDPSGNFLGVCTWGGPGNTFAQSVAIGVSNDAWVAGFFYHTADFDPGSGIDNRTSNGKCDAYLSEFDSSGNLLWTGSWGGVGDDHAWSVAIDAPGSAYVGGDFYDTVDLDPGSGVDNHTSSGYGDISLSKFDSSCAFLWARTWGDASFYSVAIDASSNAYVVGHFEGTVDFDPGSGVDSHTSAGQTDAFLTKFASTGDFLWARTWGGADSGGAKSVATDASGNTYVAGYLRGMADVDPGSGVDDHTSNGGYDVCLSKLDWNGDFLWARTWGGDYDDGAYSVAADSLGNAYVAGTFMDTVDFDPGSGVDYHTTNEWFSNAFLTKFPPDGDW